MKNTDRNNGEIGQTNEVTPDNLDKLVTDVVKLLLIKGVTIATAESCTGGRQRQAGRHDDICV